MSETNTGRDPVKSPGNHLTAPILEQLAEGLLPEVEAVEARAHLDWCARCVAEMEGFTALFGMLGALPRFAPSADFANNVMARVSLVPQEHPAFAWLRRLMPKSRPAWVLAATALVAPAIPILTLLFWMLTQPLLSPANVWQWTMIRAQSAVQASFGWVLDRLLASGFVPLAESSYITVQAVPVLVLGGILTLLAVAIPMSAWGLVRLTRNPQLA